MKNLLSIWNPLYISTVSKLYDSGIWLATSDIQMFISQAICNIKMWFYVNTFDVVFDCLSDYTHFILQAISACGQYSKLLSLNTNLSTQNCLAIAYLCSCFFGNRIEKGKYRATYISECTINWRCWNNLMIDVASACYSWTPTQPNIISLFSSCYCYLAICPKLHSQNPPKFSNCLAVLIPVLKIA